MMLCEDREQLQGMLKETGIGRETLVGNLCEALTKYTRATETDEKVSVLVEMYIMCLKAIDEKVGDVEWIVREDGFTEGWTIMSLTLYPWGRINLLSLISRAKEAPLYKHNINHYLYAFMMNVENEMYELINDDFIPICEALKVENKTQEKIKTDSELNSEDEVTSERELKALIDRIHLFGMKVNISPYKDQNTLENLKRIVITTEDGVFLKSRNIYTRDRREVKVLAQMFDEIRDEATARSECHYRMEKIVRDELNYKAEMHIWRDGGTVYYGFKKEGELDTEEGFGKVIAREVEVTFSSGICGDRGAKELDAVMNKIREELKNSHIKLYLGDDCDRF